MIEILSNFGSIFNGCNSFFCVFIFLYVNLLCVIYLFVCYVYSMRLVEIMFVGCGFERLKFCFE